ncbi:MAG: glycosyltransferase [Saprospiraceae bacterium]|nr:glycosyltransferase [Saprospiraceae bacterium]
MEFFLQIIFWGSALAMAHSYVFYPQLMRLLAAGKRPNEQVFAPDDPELPVVSVLMSVYNEERVIAEKLEHLHGLRYPPEKLFVFIGSDASDDATNEFVAAYRRRFPAGHFHFEAFAERRGKPPVINELARLAREGVPAAAGQQVFLLTDASVMLQPDTLYHLAKHFKNPAIGAVDAHMRSTGLQAEGISRSEDRYLSGEVQLKHWEGLAWGMMIGPFGGCYALRADLFEPIPPRSLVDDFWLVFRVLEKGFRAINDLDAVCLEGATHRVSDEYQRKKRIAAGSFQNLARFRRWVLPPATRLGFAFFSHKVLRWFGGFFLLAMLLSAGMLGLHNQFYCGLFWLQLIGYAGVWAALKFQHRLPGFSIAPLKNIAYFLAMNLALLDGFFKWARGIRSGAWQRTNRA